MIFRRKTESISSLGKTSIGISCNKQAFIADIAKDIPSGYDYDRWNNYPSGEKYRELERLREQNSRIERAKAFPQRL